MRVVHVLHILRPAAMGGCEKHLLSLLPRLRERGHGVSLCLLAEAGPFARLTDPLVEAGVDVRVMDPGPHVDPVKPARLRRVVREARPDLVHTHSLDGDLYGQLAARSAGVPGVSSIHGTYPFYRREPYRSAARVAGRLAERTVAISDHVACFLQEVGIVPPERIRRIPYGIDAASWAVDDSGRRAARSSFGAADDVVVGVTSRLVPAKGHGVLIDAVARALEEVPSLCLWIAGDGPLREELERHAGAVLPAGRFRFHGFVEDMPTFLSACDVLAFPTLPSFGEGFGMSALEGMAAGLPVVATRLDSLPELVVDDRTGLLVSPDSVDDLAAALVLLAGDPERRRAMGEAGCRRARTVFPEESAVQGTVELYDEILEGSDHRVVSGSRPSAAPKAPTRRTWDRVWEERRVEETYSNEDRIGRQLDRVVDLRGSTVLEVGAGSGRDGAQLVHRGARVVEVDYSPTALGLLHRLVGDDRVHVLGADAFHLPFADGAFDVVFHQGLLEHFGREEARALLAENVRTLRPGGLLLVDVPQRFHPYTLLKHVLIASGRWFAGWERSFSEPELRRVLRGMGLETVHTYGEWMVPSLPYRLLREALRRVLRVRLPLYPVAPFGRLRDVVRSALQRTPLPRYTGISIGVVARRPASPDEEEGSLRAVRGASSGG